MGTVTVESLLRQDRFCTYDEAYAGFADQLRWSIEDTRTFMNKLQSQGFELISGLKNAFAVSVTSKEFGSVGQIKTSASACTHQPTSMPTSVAGSSGGSNTNSGGSKTVGAASSSMDYIPLYMAGLIIFALMSLVYVFYSNRNKAILGAKDQDESAAYAGDRYRNNIGDDHQVSGGTQHVAHANASAVELTPEFLDYNYGEATDMDPNASATAYDLTDFDDGMLEDASSMDFFARPAVGAPASSIMPTMSVTTETDSAASLPRTSSGFGSFRSNKNKPGRSLNLSTLRKSPAAAPTTTANSASASASVSEANRSWSEAYQGDMWRGDDI